MSSSRPTLACAPAPPSAAARRLLSCEPLPGPSSVEAHEFGAMRVEDVGGNSAPFAPRRQDHDYKPSGADVFRVVHQVPVLFSWSCRANQCSLQPLEYPCSAPVGSRRLRSSWPWSTSMDCRSKPASTNALTAAAECSPSAIVPTTRLVGYGMKVRSVRLVSMNSISSRRYLISAIELREHVDDIAGKAKFYRDSTREANRSSTCFVSALVSCTCASTIQRDLSTPLEMSVNRSAVSASLNAVASSIAWRAPWPNVANASRIAPT